MLLVCYAGVLLPPRAREVVIGLLTANKGTQCVPQPYQLSSPLETINDCEAMLLLHSFLVCVVIPSVSAAPLVIHVHFPLHHCLLDVRYAAENVENEF